LPQARAIDGLRAQIAGAQAGDLMDSTVTVRGVCVTSVNRQRQLFDIRLLVPQPTDLVVDIPAPSDPFAVKAQPIEKLLQFAPPGPYGHRSRWLERSFITKEHTIHRR